MNRGKLYVFFGASGTGKDYMKELFIKYCNENKISITECKSYFTRPKRKNEQNDELHQYGLSKEIVCSPKNIFSEINNEYLGIDKNDLENKLANGQNVVLVTGSINIINEFINSEYYNDMCLIYMALPGLSIDYYLDLEYERHSNMTDKLYIQKSAIARYENSRKVHKYYLDNQEVFDYTYLNITKTADPEIVADFHDVFFANFFKKVTSGEYVSGPNWLAIPLITNKPKKKQ